MEETKPEDMRLAERMEKAKAVNKERISKGYACCYICGWTFCSKNTGSFLKQRNKENVEVMVHRYCLEPK